VERPARDPGPRGPRDREGESASQDEVGQGTGRRPYKRVGTVGPRNADQGQRDRGLGDKGEREHRRAEGQSHGGCLACSHRSSLSAGGELACSHRSSLSAGGDAQGHPDAHRGIPDSCALRPPPEPPGATPGRRPLATSRWPQNRAATSGVPPSPPMITRLARGRRARLAGQARLAGEGVS